MEAIKKFKKSKLRELLKEENLLEFNREINEKHVKSLLNSVLECGLLRLPIIGDFSAFDSNRKYVIIDGQHLCSAITQLPIDEVDCMVKKYKSRDEVIMDISKLNNTQKVWNDENYLDAWYKFGKDNIDYYTNYAYLYNAYNHTFDGLPCGFMIDLYAENKNAFKRGGLTLKDREFSDKIAQICLILQNDFKKGSFTLHGLRIWAVDMKFKKHQDIDYKKLLTRLKAAINNNEDENCNGREDFRWFIDRIYER